MRRTWRTLALVVVQGKDVVDRRCTLDSGGSWAILVGGGCI